MVVSNVKRELQSNTIVQDITNRNYTYVSRSNTADLHSITSISNHSWDIKQKEHGRGNEAIPIDQSRKMKWFMESFA